MLGIQLSNQQPYITYATGDENRFNYFETGFACSGGSETTYWIDYNGGTFEKIPQIIYSVYSYKFYLSTANEFTFLVPQKNTTHFQVQITCRYIGEFVVLGFTWIAFDNPNIQVIDVFNISMQNQNSQIYSFPISSPIFTQGFTSLISFGFNGRVNFNITIINITSDTVNVQFDSTATGLLQLGYQIVVGTQEAFTFTPFLHITAYTSNNSYTDPVTNITTPGTQGYYTDFLPKLDNSILILPYVGVYYKFDIRIKQYRYISFQNSTHLQYFYHSSIIVFYLDDNTYIDLYARIVQFNKLTHYTPFFCYKMRISKAFNPFVAKLPKIIVSISEIALLYDTLQSQNVLIDKSKKSLILTVELQCNVGQQVTGTVYKVEKYFTFTQRCFQTINYLTYHIELRQNDNTYSSFQVNVLAAGISVIQTVYNLPRETYTLASISIIG